MTKTETKKQRGPTYNDGQFPTLWRFLVKLHAESPQAFDSAEYLRAHVAQVWPALNDRTMCPNCGENMVEYLPKLDFFNALLLKKMGDVIDQRIRKGMPFTEANQVHVVSQDFHDCVRHRTTQCRSLGLIAKVRNDKGGHAREKGWLITRRGFDALRGDKIPAEVTVFRNKIIKRSEEMTTLAEVFEMYEGANKDQLGEYDPMRWVTFGGMHTGEML